MFVKSVYNLNQSICYQEHHNMTDEEGFEINGNKLFYRFQNSAAEQGIHRYFGKVKVQLCPIFFPSAPQIIGNFLCLIKTHYMNLQQ